VISASVIRLPAGSWPERIWLRMTQEQVAVRMGVSVARVSQIERGDVSTQDVLNRYVSALGGTLKLIADFGDEPLKIA
jgi:transcriptional regulator with XRE-family HTH domain